MSGRTIFKEELEELASEIIKKCSTGLLTEIEFGWPCTTVIRVLDGSCSDTPKVIIRCSSQKVRAFGTACRTEKNAHIPFTSLACIPTTAEAI
jgi:hypothetical protein